MPLPSNWSSIVRRVKQKVFETYGMYICQRCFKQTGTDVDHKIPRAHGGTNETNNLWLICHDCHLAKGKEDYKKYPRP